MSTNGNYWKPRKAETLVTPLGVTVQVMRPGPEFALRAGRIAKTFTQKKPTEQERQEMQGLTPEEIGLQALASMDDDELASVMIFARELVCAMLVSPKLVREPRPDHNEIGPDDIGDDFWFLFNYGMENYYGLKVPAGDGEVEISDLESFRGEPSVSGDSPHGEVVRDMPESITGDRGLVSGA